MAPTKKFTTKPEEKSTPTKGSTSPSKYSMNMSPVRNYKKGANNIDMYVTKVPGIFISVASKPKDYPEATYIHPYKKIFNECDGEGEDYSIIFNICGFFPRKNYDQTVISKQI